MVYSIHGQQDVAVHVCTADIRMVMLWCCVGRSVHIGVSMVSRI